MSSATEGVPYGEYGAILTLSMCFQVRILWITAEPLITYLLYIGISKWHDPLTKFQLVSRMVYSEWIWLLMIIKLSRHKFCLCPRKSERHCTIRIRRQRRPTGQHCTVFPLSDITRILSGSWIPKYSCQKLPMNAYTDNCCLRKITFKYGAKLYLLLYQTT